MTPRGHCNTSHVYLLVKLDANINPSGLYRYYHRICGIFPEKPASY